MNMKEQGSGYRFVNGSSNDWAEESGLNLRSERELRSILRSLFLEKVMSYRKLGRPIEILLVDDNPGDVDLAREALSEGKIVNNLSVAQDGVEALAFLRREAQFAGTPAPQ